MPARSTKVRPAEVVRLPPTKVERFRFRSKATPKIKISTKTINAKLPKTNNVPRISIYSPFANAAMCGGILCSLEVFELPPLGAGVLNQACHEKQKLQNHLTR